VLYLDSLNVNKKVSENSDLGA